ncbi:hypothetical protein [Nakamurella deserti]|uniref:hypothetical protein n=1 Tax=Nakamurella deserti TaxID=2164074 RepID=UPI000DBE2AB8|nr:hypothetical protein [Nakamurella deserti]
MRWRALMLTAAILTGLTVSTGTASAAPVDDAIAAAVAQADQYGVTSYLTVVDRATGEVAGETGNAHVQVASESVMKLFLASYYATEAGGADLLSESRRASLEEMIEYSDDDIASALFTEDAIPSQAQRYGLTETANADNPGEWGAARITAHDTALFLYRMSSDPQVGPWLMTVMARTAPNGHDGFDQFWGFNALDGDHGSKQGWGSENWTAQRNAVHSVGFTDRWFAAVLQTGGSGTYYTMHDTATASARLIQDAQRASLAPVGRLEAVAVDAATATATATGWSFDPTDAAARIAVDVTTTAPDGTATTTRTTAAVDRPDVAFTTGAPGGHGFSVAVPVSAPGQYSVCATGIDGGDSPDTPLGCQSYEVAVPVAAPTTTGWSWAGLVPRLSGPVDAALAAWV